METTRAHGQQVLRAIRPEREAFFPSLSGPVVNIAGRGVGEEQPVFVIAEIGINHNGSLELCEKLIEGAVRAGCDAVKFQKRTPELCVPLEQWDVMRDTPWGRMTYIDYKRKIEFGQSEFEHVDRVCRRLGVPWFASAWDIPSIEFLETFQPPCYKAASASVTCRKANTSCASSTLPIHSSSRTVRFRAARAAISGDSCSAAARPCAAW